MRQKTYMDLCSSPKFIKKKFTFDPFTVILLSACFGTCLILSNEPTRDLTLEYFDFFVSDTREEDFPYRNVDENSNDNDFKKVINSQKISSNVTERVKSTFNKNKILINEDITILQEDPIDVQEETVPQELNDTELLFEVNVSRKTVLLAQHESIVEESIIEESIDEPVPSSLNTIEIPPENENKDLTQHQQPIETIKEANTNANLHKEHLKNDNSPHQIKFIVSRESKSGEIVKNIIHNK
ncbi:10138_t:CDS:2 [Entrophospora sp. SA101]|nr:10138_t:CDS:2 [Entrophospora sp. SA101]